MLGSIYNKESIIDIKDEIGNSLGGRFFGAPAAPAGWTTF